MTLKLDWFGLAEGAVADTRGTLTLVGFAPEFLRYRSLPASANLAVVVVIDDDEEPAPILHPGTTLTIALTVKAPDGRVIFAHQPTVTVGEKQFADLPGRLNLIFQVQVTFMEPGEYTVLMTVQPKDADQVLEADRKLHIMEGG